MSLRDFVAPEREELLRMDEAQLNALCTALRERIIHAVRQNGGHLASNLGVVELTVALHRVLDTTHDRLVFDVGHQAYAHKLLTGRNEPFSSLRHDGGVSGFALPSESPHDAFGAGHASTSISAALGLARARDARSQTHAVVALLGDGALTGGLAYEALNDAGQSNTPFIIILNDNEMSISKNVGAVARLLTRMRARPGWWRAKRRVQRALNSVPRVGRWLSNLIYRFKSGVKHLVLPGGLFEELGFVYFGPIDGHDIHGIETMLKNALALASPVVLHVVTQKGKGYAPAEHEPERYHGVAPYEIELNGTGRTDAGHAMAACLAELASTDARVMAVTAAMRHGTGLDAFALAHPMRFWDVGIAEAHAVTMAAGLAAGGMKPFVALYATFFQRATDSMLHDVITQRLPVTLLIDRAGLAAADGATHHGIYDLALLCPAPGLTIYSPKTTRDLRRMMAAALLSDGPVCIRYAKTFDDTLPTDDLPIDRWPALHVADNPHAALLSFGRMIETAMAACSQLEQQGLRVSLYDARRLKPLDEALLRDLGDLPLITLEDGVSIGGWGGMVSAWRIERALPASLALGLPDTILPHGSEERLYARAKLMPADIAERIQAFLMARDAHG